VDRSSSGVKNLKLYLERLGCIYFRRNNTHQVDPQSVRIATVRRTVSYAATAIAPDPTNRALSTV
ncbi:MAG: hypothetical protein WBE24_08105, partial [Candidatus Acidiferrum sp.]